jgi:CTP:molybdopterin cytidylyltransferase MocA
VTPHGLLLAAGAGRRMGRPKALLTDDTGEPWLVRAVRTLRDGGCDPVTVVLGAAADEAGSLLDGTGVRVVVAVDWAEGMGASLRAGLAALLDDDGAVGADGTDGVGGVGGARGPGPVAAVVSLVDLPDVHADVVRRLVAAGADAGPAALARAAYGGTPGHPVLLGRDHWAGVVASATGDRGARDYLASREVRLVESGDLATGCDRDTP